MQLLIVEGQRIAHAFAHVHRINGTDVEALIHVLIADQRGISVTAGDLARALGLTSSSVTALLDRLERSGHLRRERDRTDRRRVTVHYDPSGMQLAMSFFAPLGQLHRRVADTFTAEELDVVERYLATTVSAFRQYRDQLDTRQAHASDPGNVDRPAASGQVRPQQPPSPRRTEGRRPRRGSGRAS